MLGMARRASMKGPGVKGRSGGMRRGYMWGMAWGVSMQGARCGGRGERGRFIGCCKLI